MAVRLVLTTSVVLLALTGIAVAQGRGLVRGGTPGMVTARPGTGGPRIDRGFFPRHRFGRRFVFGPGYLGYSDFFEPYAEETMQPQVVVLHEEVEHDSKVASLIQPKLIELPTSDAHARPQSNQPAFLVWRNGQQEEVTHYAIIGSLLYDFAKPRAWRIIPLADLDLDATQRVNQQRGVELLIPAGADEVTVRF